MSDTDSQRTTMLDKWAKLANDYAAAYYAICFIIGMTIGWLTR